MAGQLIHLPGQAGLDRQHRLSLLEAPVVRGFGRFSRLTATFRFYAELNSFLAPARRGRAFVVECAPAATAKHMIEVLGVPHTEVELILINGQAAGFEHLLQQGDQLAVYPTFVSFDISSLQRLRDLPSRPCRFIADAHLGGLAVLLRMAGFDTLYRNDFHDVEIAEIASREGRIVLSRDRDLLKHRVITHGCYIHALKPPAQFGELVARLGLAEQQQPFTRCMACNLPLHAIAREAAFDKLPPGVRANYVDFTTCDGCGRIYWRGSHWQRMATLVDAAVAGGRAGTGQHVAAG